VAILVNWNASKKTKGHSLTKTSDFTHKSGVFSIQFLKFNLPVGLKHQIVLFVEIALVYRKSWQFVILHKRFQDGQLGPTWS